MFTRNSIYRKPSAVKRTYRWHFEENCDGWFANEALFASIRQNETPEQFVKMAMHDDVLFYSPRCAKRGAAARSLENRETTRTNYHGQLFRQFIRSFSYKQQDIKINV